MKIINKNPVIKRVNYLGHTLIVPYWTRYIGFDQSGSLFAFHFEPMKVENRFNVHGHWINREWDAKVQFIGKVVDSKIKWNESLREFIQTNTAC